jgi:hypothetical protein
MNMPDNVRTGTLVVVDGSDSFTVALIKSGEIV